MTAYKFPHRRPLTEQQKRHDLDSWRLLGEPKEDWGICASLRHDGKPCGHHAGWEHEGRHYCGHHAPPGSLRR